MIDFRAIVDHLVLFDLVVMHTTTHAKSINAVVDFEVQYGEQLKIIGN